MRDRANLSMISRVNMSSADTKTNLYKEARAEKRSAEDMKDPEKAAHDVAVTQAMKDLESLNAMQIAHLANYALKEWGRPYDYRMKEEGGEAGVYARGEIGVHPWMAPFIDRQKGGYKPGVATALTNILKAKPYKELQAKINYKGEYFTTENYDGNLCAEGQRLINAPLDWRTRKLKRDIAKQVTTDARLAGKVEDTETQTQPRVPWTDKSAPPSTENNDASGNNNDAPSMNH